MIGLIGGILSKQRKRHDAGQGAPLVAAANGAGPVSTNGGASDASFVEPPPPQQAGRPSSDLTQPVGLLDFICASPLLPACGLIRQDVLAELPAWVRLGDQVIASLGLPPADRLDRAAKRRVFQYYLPVFVWCRRQLEAHRRRHGAGGSSQRAPPLVLGISAPQGCGKTTLCSQLEQLFASIGCTAASISIDDFYLTRREQLALAAANPGNPLLQQRGNAASHDLALGTQALQELRAATAPGSSVAVPRYDKSAHAGQGDRAPRPAWPLVQGPVDVVLFEGWMLGFSPISDEAAAAVDPSLAPINAALRAYEAAWDSFADAWLVVKVAQPEFAYRWRLQAEQAMRAEGKPAMTDEQVQQFVDRFMPAYRAYLPGLYARGPTTAAPGRLLMVEVDESREPKAVQPAPIM